MEETALIERLMLFSLSRQEATIYLCLLKNNELTGYEVAKLTGISRSNVYNSLASLVEHGAAYVLEGVSTRYTAVNMAEFCENHLHNLQEVKDYLVSNSPKRIVNSDGYITIEGYRHICDKIHLMLIGAQMRIYFSANHEFLAKWKTEISNLVEKGIKVVLISEEFPKEFLENESMQKGIIFYKTYADFSGESTPEQSRRQVRLIIDSEYVLTGEVMESNCDTCLYSAQRNFVNVFKEAMRNEIELIKIKERMEK